MKNWIKTILVFAVIAGLLFAGDYMKTHKKNVTVATGKAKLDSNPPAPTLNDPWDSMHFIIWAAPNILHKPYFIQERRDTEIKYLPVVTEKERLEHPSLTAVQIQRAKWNYERFQFENAPQDGSAPKKHLTPEDKKRFGSDITQIAIPLDVIAWMKKSISVYQSGVDVPIPAIATGELPVFTDKETQAFNADMVKNDLEELDFRRAAWWFKNKGRAPIPQMPEDLKARKEQAEALNITDEQAADPSLFTRRYNAKHMPVALTENERLSMAGDILLKLNLPK